MEFEAFRSWIVKAVKDPNLLAAKHEGKALGPSVPDEVIRHGRKDRVLASFIENVWSERKRCEHCHSPDKNQKQVKEHGEKVSWMKVNDPRGTLDKLLEQKLIDLENPEKSQILTKPTLLVEHKGGRKMLLGDRSYIQFFRFAKDLAATTGGEYQTVEDLPKPPEEFSVNSDHVLRITGVPTRYFKKFVRVDIHPWVEKDKNWSKIRWATGYAMVFARGRFLQTRLILTAPREADLAWQFSITGRLTPGRYQVKIYIDQKEKKKQSPTYELGKDEFVA